jgi:hypothetical protein
LILLRNNIVDPDAVLRNAWLIVRSVVEDVVRRDYEGLYDVAAEVLEEIRRYERMERKFIGIAPYVIIDEEPITAINIHTDRGDIILITEAAITDVRGLAHIILHELIHSIGMTGGKEEEDELLTDYLVSEFIEKTKGAIAKEDALKWTPQCNEGCSTIGKAIQEYINQQKIVTLREFKANIEKYLDKAKLVNPSHYTISSDLIFNTFN